MVKLHCRPTILSGWRNTVEIVLFDISNSLKPYPPEFLAYTSKMRPVIGFSEPAKLIEVSNRIPPTSDIKASYVLAPAAEHRLSNPRIRDAVNSYRLDQFYTLAT